MTVRTDYTREELIVICEQATVPETGWHDRDSYEAQFQVGECWALLRAGCEFDIHGVESDPATDDQTIWLTTWGKGFSYFENHESGDDPRAYKEDELHYLPTPERLAKVEKRQEKRRKEYAHITGAGDWY